MSPIDIAMTVVGILSGCVAIFALYQMYKIVRVERKIKSGAHPYIKSNPRHFGEYDE